MTLNEIEAHAKQQLALGFDFMTLVLPRSGWKAPAKFPKGELLCVTERGRVKSFKASRILKWVEWARTQE